MISRRISGRYEILKKIGSGGMANVYLANDLILERKVAIKLLAFDFTDDQESLRRFRREALSTTELIHPNIVNIYDVGEGEYPYIVMEYVDGMDLNDYIKTKSPIPHTVVLNIMDQILSGMSYAHSKGIIHRDLKPHNILIDKEGNVKITDFGIAVALSKNSITQTNSLLGSVHYLSPEQARGAISTKQSDIYSLGVLLYELLLGKVPFDGESAVSIVLKHFQNEMPSLKEQDDSIPQALENVVLKATTKDPHQRYSSVEEMRKDLSTSLDPKRANEPKFEAIDYSDDATRVLSPLSKTQLVEAQQTNSRTNSVEKEEKPTKKKSFIKRYWWVGLLAALAIFIGAAFLLKPKEVAVPNLQDMTYEEAVAELERLELEVGKKVEESSADVEDGKIIKSDPKAGTTIRKNQKVNLYVSKDPEMKNYIGKNFEEARAELTEMKIEVSSEEVASDEHEVGKILDQNIESGEKIKPGRDKVIFTISKGPENKEITLANLVGHTKSYVTDYASKHNLNVSFESVDAEDVEEGAVASQSPKAGTILQSGDQITVYISSGKKKMNSFSESVNIPFKENDEANASGNHIEVYIEDANRSIDVLAYEFYIKADTSHKINFEVESGNTARYRVLRDGEVIEEKTINP